jgi:hypothetical protein
MMSVVVGGGNRHWYGQLTNEEILGPLPEGRCPERNYCNIGGGIAAVVETGAGRGRSH